MAARVSHRFGEIAMWQYPSLDPVAISLGPVSIHWYAITYLVGIAFVWWSVGLRIRTHRLKWTQEQVSDLIFYGVLGVILGGRIGYVLFYGFDNLLADPLSALKIWQGGMSFHGGFLGVLAGALVYAKLHDRHFFDITDMIAPSIPIALGAGRIGNFINGELPGRVTEMWWGVQYPGEIIARHPSSLYQALLEGPVLFGLLWVYASRKRPRMAVSAMFLIGYGSFRIVSEFFREPDPQLGYIAFNWMTTGQLLSLPMLITGLGFFALIYSSKMRRNQ